MASSQKQPAAPAHTPVDLRDPAWAALLAWLWPGAGHIYQRRYAKGALFMICILGIFFYGLMLGSGRVVYASWKPNDRRWQFACQIGVGLPAFPAIVQSFKTKNDGKPYFPLAERFPPNHLHKFEIMTEQDLADYEGQTLTDGFMAPPPGPVIPELIDVLGKWHEELLHRFELGTLFTIVAGLLNILAIYDAFAGPAYEDPEEEKKRKRKKRGSQDEAENQEEADDD